MTRASTISPPQLKRLQTLYSLYERAQMAPITAEKRREARLDWAAGNCGRRISSFRELTRDEANGLIDVLETFLGQPGQPNPWEKSSRGRQHLDGDAARQAGTEGRRRPARLRKQAVASVAGAQDLARITQALTRLGWDQARFEAWLRAPSSPLQRRPQPIQVRTVGDANRVWWALKSLLRRQGKWRESA